MSDGRDSRGFAVSGMIVVIRIAALLIAVASIGSAQQTYVTRFDAYAGYNFLDSPHVGLSEHGAGFQAGVRANRWLSFGFDYTVSSGDLTITPSLLTSALQQFLASQPIPPSALAGLTVPTHSVTQTFAVGPQVSYRHMQHATIFFRPVFAGLIHEKATPQPTDPLTTAIAKDLAPSGFKTDTVGFVGFGGGFDVIFSRHVSLRTQADLVYDHLFSDTLQDGRFTCRFSIGPAFNFGGNIAK